ncbi:hypothetical protein VA599_16635 [Chromobacterium sp. TRC.1.1.SA]|uniref:Uncharacterized protein n=1 Tax=Chromobacterium indicum TaxID=3110228 RepID=A0ABV0CMH4_9NEIS
MADRKYRYKNPENHNECIIAIYEELTATPKKNYYDRPTETLKDYTIAILEKMKEAESRRTYDLEREVNATSWALGALAMLGLVFLANGFSDANDWEWLSNHRFAIKLWGIAISASFIGVSIERSSFFKNLWSFGVTKVIASLAVSVLFVFSSGKAGSLINSVFPVDASALPFTRAITAGLLAFQYTYPLLIVVALFAFFHAINTVTWLKMKLTGKGKYELPPVQSFAFLILSIAVLLFVSRWVNQDFSDTAWPAKIYRLAHTLDFNSKYECTNLRQGLSVVFLGADHSRVLVDVTSAQTDSLESFVDSKLSGEVIMPGKFYVLPCDAGMPKPR